MQTRDVRYLWLVAACAALLVWGHERKADEQASHAERPRTHEPDLIADRLGGDDLRRITAEQSRRVRLDQDVRPAAAHMLTTSSIAMLAVGQDDFAMTQVEQGDYRWRRDQFSVIWLLDAKAKVTVSGVGPVDAGKFKIGFDGPPQQAITPAVDDGVWSVEFGLPHASLRTVTIDGGTAGSDPITIALRQPGGEPPTRPVISHAATNKHAAPQPKPGSGRVLVYDDYLHLKGQSVQTGTQLEFHVFEISGAKKKYYGSASVETWARGANGVWDAELRLSPVPMAGHKYQVVAVAAAHGNYNVSLTDGVLEIEGSTQQLLDTPPDLQVRDAAGRATRAGQTAYVGERTVQVFGAAPSDASARVAIFLAGADQPLAFSQLPPTRDGWTAAVTLPADGVFQLEAATVLGDTVGKHRSRPVEILARSLGPRVVSVEPTNLAYARDARTVIVQFDPQIPLDGGMLTDHSVVIRDGKGIVVAIENRVFNPTESSLTVVAKEAFSAGNYTLTVQRDHVVDRFGKRLKSDYTAPLFMPLGGDAATIARGITGPTGPYVEFSEFTAPRKPVDGFNPSDHVETRVSRLYYFRDAHRVAQIINREAKSYNRAAVDMQQQLADKARQLADQATDDRRAKQRSAIEAARRTREAEQQLQQAEQTAQMAAEDAFRARQSLREAQEAAGQQSEAERLSDRLQIAERVAAAARAQVDSAAVKVQQLREAEAQASEEVQIAAAKEDRARENQFRREVAAAHSDPDTYAPGRPDSQDPVRQVSVSVIGEGLIQLRGPIKGINVIRNMINQIDAPVGQVRVGVHTVQINGEKGDRMEIVAGKIQRYIDHSRFLTLQSGEMLRKAIVQVAAQKAMELGTIPGMTQQQRDRSYLHAFFGEDFVRELQAMDSEFLHTGNKLLSIHSMDSTSLASAMFVMALAKNTTRMQILQTFEGMMAGELPVAEQNYFEAGLTCDGKERLFGKHCKRDEFQLLSQNARFQSMQGMFNAEFTVDDAMTPIQREFVRLAQIFKSRLIVEMELKQRIMERAVIEERLGDWKQELQEAVKVERQAKEKLHKAQTALQDARKSVLVAAVPIQAKIQATRDQSDNASISASQGVAFWREFFERAFGSILRNEVGIPAGKDELFQAFRERLKQESRPVQIASTLESYYRSTLQRAMNAPLEDNDSIGRRLYQTQKDIPYLLKEAEYYRSYTLPPELQFHFHWNSHLIALTVSKDGSVTVVPADLLQQALEAQISTAEEIKRALELFNYTEQHAEQLQRARSLLNRIKQDKQDESRLLDNLHRSMTVFKIYEELADHVMERAGGIARDMNAVIAHLGDDRSDVNDAYRTWIRIQEQIERYVGTELRQETRHLLTAATTAFERLIEANLEREFALHDAEGARRPLDHKKFLDMLVDEMEDKYIELLEGTRAHTANIDAYIKRLMTSLDDDFNTQFYYPTFRKVREASQLWDVQMGQVETTTVLANNRAFAKVTPQATMEFDLPKRDILIAEAMDGAKAMVQDFGALAQDPTFLAMAKLRSGQPTSTPASGAAGGQSTVRNVLPGLSTDTAESVMSQHGPGGSQFGAALENLIPDPAIYKFETGTGWEIRPVIQPDGQAVVFDFNYMYTTNIREPVRADDKHLGRVKRHYVDTDVQLSNFELREISRYTVALKASRTSRGVPLFEDIPVVGTLFRPLPSDESSLQQNIILGQSTIFPTLFDLMGLRWAPVVADLDPLRLSNDEFIVRNRRRALMNRVFDHSSSQVDEFLRIPAGERRMDLYRSQETIPAQHPNGYQGPGANLRDSQLQEGYDPAHRGETQFVPGQSSEGSPYLRSRRRQPEPLYEVPLYQPQAAPRDSDQSSLQRPTDSANGIANAEYRLGSDEMRFRGQQAEYVTTPRGRAQSRLLPQLDRLPPVGDATHALPNRVPRPGGG